MLAGPAPAAGAATVAGLVTPDFDFESPDFETPDFETLDFVTPDFESPDFATPGGDTSNGLPQAGQVTVPTIEPGKVIW